MWRFREIFFLREREGYSARVNESRREKEILFIYVLFVGRENFGRKKRGDGGEEESGEKSVN